MSHDDQLDLVALVVRMKAGDTLAYEQLYLRLNPRMAKRARRLGIPEADAIDVVHSGWEKCLKNRNSIRYPERFEAWIGKLMRREMQQWLERYRRDCNRRDPAVRVELLLASDVPSDRSQLFELLSGIPEDEVTALVLKYVDEMTHHEIRDRTGWTEGRIDYLLNRGKAMLSLKFEVRPNPGPDGAGPT